jgi:hypothetical protein
LCFFLLWLSTHAVVDDGPLTACSPAVVPGAGRVARSAPAPGLPTAAPMSRGPPPPAPVSFRCLTIFSRNRFCVYSSASVSPAAPPDPGFRVCGPPSGPSVSARAFLVSVDRRSPLVAARVSAFTMFLTTFALRFQVSGYAVVRHISRHAQPNCGGMRVTILFSRKVSARDGHRLFGFTTYNVSLPSLLRRKRTMSRGSIRPHGASSSRSWRTRRSVRPTRVGSSRCFIPRRPATSLRGQL